MDPYYFLRKHVNKNGKQAIQLCYSHMGKKLRLDVGIKTKAIYWDKENERIVSRCSEIGQDAKELNATLKEKKQKLEKIILDYKREYSYSPDVGFVEEQFFLEGNKIITAKEVKEEFKAWIAQKEKRVKYIKIFNTVLIDLKEFHPKPLYYRDLNATFFNDLRDFWLNLNPPIQNSTIIKRLRCFKMFLFETYKSGENENDYFTKFDLGLVSNKRQPIIIPTPEEFKILVEYNLLSRKFDDARDLYVIGCSTGLRYSDVVRLTPQNIVGDYLIADITKTEEAQLRIPLNDISAQFLNKQFAKYGRVKEISNQKLNAVLTGLINPETPDELPEGGLFRFISENHPDHPFSDQVITLERYGNQTIPKKKPKWLALSFHSSRKYFISYLVNVAMVDIGNVMAWSGHSNLETVNSYIQKGQRQKEVMKEAFKIKQK